RSPASPDRTPTAQAGPVRRRAAHGPPLRTRPARERPAPRPWRVLPRTLLLAPENLADGSEDSLGPLGRGGFRRLLPALALLLPRGLQRIRRVLGREHDFLRSGIGRQPLDGDVHQALLVEVEAHPLARRLGGKLERPEVLVVDDLVAVALEDVEVLHLPLFRLG